MTEKRYIVTLTESERVELEGMLSRGKNASSILRRVRILLKADTNFAEGGWTDSRIKEALDVTEALVYRTRKLFVEEGVKGVISRKKREVPPTPCILDGEKEARLIAIACSKAPEGYSRWTLQMLADRMIELKIVETISDKTVGRALKKMKLNRILERCG